MRRLAWIAALCLTSAAHSQTTTQPEQAAVAAPSAAEVSKATGYVKDAWNHYSQCRPSACKVYFDTFGVALSFGDGSIAPFAHAQRLTASSRDCIKTAKAYLKQGNRSLAVQWVMATRVEDPLVRGWLGSHPDAVLEALRHCCW